MNDRENEIETYAGVVEAPVAGVADAAAVSETETEALRQL